MSPTVTVRVSDSTGNETVGTKTFQVGGGAAPLIGDVSGVLADARIVGDLNLTGDVFSEGLLTGINTFHVQGNGFTWFFQNGGRADLHGKVKAPWGLWGTDATGWIAGDQIAVAPTKDGIYTPAVMAWTGDWATMIRPVNSPDVTLIDGTIAVPEVANLSQSIVFENLARGWHAHGSAGVFNVSDIKMLNCGTTGVLGNYPIHLHMVGENARGSLFERVVVEGGKNHAFVPHASHGITYKDCVAYKTVDDAFWWDLPEGQTPTHTANNSNDTDWDHCLVLGLTGSSPAKRGRLAAFMVGAGSSNRVAFCTAAAIDGGTQCNGYHWPEAANNNAGGTVWEFHHNTTHNSKASGFFSWQNDGTFHADQIHQNEDLIAYNCVTAAVDHGAYLNKYHWRRVVAGPNVGRSVKSHAAPLDADGDIRFENIISTAPFEIRKHNADRPSFVIVKGLIPSVIVRELDASPGNNPGRYRFEDTGLDPTDFTFISVDPDSVFLIIEAGVEAYRYENGTW
jgi:hypothetical protein